MLIAPLALCLCRDLRTKLVTIYFFHPRQVVGRSAMSKVLIGWDCLATKEPNGSEGEVLHTYTAIQQEALFLSLRRSLMIVRREAQECDSGETRPRAMSRRARREGLDLRVAAPKTRRRAFPQRRADCGCRKSFLWAIAKRIVTQKNSPRECARNLLQVPSRPIRLLRVSLPVGELARVKPILKMRLLLASIDVCD
jgi:hypothetical protein